MHIDESIPIFNTITPLLQLQTETHGNKCSIIIQNANQKQVPATSAKEIRIYLYLYLNEAFEVPASQSYSVICLIKEYFQHYNMLHIDTIHSSIFQQKHMM